MCLRRRLSASPIRPPTDSTSNIHSATFVSGPWCVHACIQAYREFKTQFMELEGWSKVIAGQTLVGPLDSTSPGGLSPSPKHGTGIESIEILDLLTCCTCSSYPGVMPLQPVQGQISSRCAGACGQVCRSDTLPGTAKRGIPNTMQSFPLTPTARVPLLTASIAYST